ncbi:MAG TPA: WD40 repeat domain-containing serine/threonine-protein kinase [Thermosynechococcaceae cyanobacterium]
MTYCLNPACTQPTNPDDAEFCLSCGTKLVALLRGRYRVLKPIGQGGFGRTYLAVDEDRLTSRCVVKQFSPQLQEGSKSLEKAIKLFDQEAVRLDQLGEHPQIPALLAYFEHDKRLYLVQQFVEGPTLLQEIVQNGMFNEQRIRAVLAGILPILKYVHDHQVIHRDITPSNIIRRRSDNRLVLIDFGVAKLLSADAAAPGTRIGTEGYAPMEQLRSGKAYPASDLYSLAATCLFLMTRTKPDDLYDPLEGRWMWREQLRHRGGAISDPIAHILDKMLKDLVSDRYPSADAVMRDLRMALSRPVATFFSRTAPPTHPIHPTQPPAPPSGGGPASGRPVSSGAARANPSDVPSKPASGGTGRRCLHTLEHPRGWVTAVAISPNGETLASGGLDDCIRLWSLTTGELLQTLTGHTKPLNCLAFSPGGQTLVSCSDDDTIKVWALSTGRLIRTLTGHTRDVNSVAIDRDGLLLVSGSEDRTVRLWRLETGATVQTFPVLSGMIRSVTFSADGQLVASGGLDNQIRLWSVQTGQQVRAFAKGHFNSVNAVLIRPDGKTLISASKDKTIKLWDLNRGEVVRTLAGHQEAVNAIALSSDGKWLVSGSSDKTVKLWSLDTSSLLTTFSEHSNSVNTVAISLDGRIAASGSSDETVRVWQLG